MGAFQIRVKVEKNPELGFSISGGVGGRGNPFRPDDNVVKLLFPLFQLAVLLKRGSVGGFAGSNVCHAV